MWELSDNVHSSANFDVVNMSYHPYRLQSIENERRLLEKMLTLQNKVREAREKERQLKSSQSSHYTKIFQPITSSLKHLKQSQVMKVDSSTITDKSSDNGNTDSSNGLDTSGDNNEKFKLNSVIVKDNPGDLYKDALNSVPIKSRDDGVFGLNVTTKHIGNYTFLVDEDTLHVMDHEDQVGSYVIDDYELWQLLLVKRPRDIGLKLKDARGRETPQHLTNIFGLLKTLIS